MDKLGQVEVQLNADDMSKHSFDERYVLSNSILEASAEAIHDGSVLLGRISSDDNGADGVRQKASKYCVTVSLIGYLLLIV